MDIGYTSKNLPTDHIDAISNSDEFRDKQILVIVNALIDFTEILKVLPQITSNIEYTAGFTAQDYLIITQDSISFINSRVKSKKPLYSIHIDSLADFSHTKGFFQNKIQFELNNPLRKIECKILDNQDLEKAIEAIRIIHPPMNAEKIRQNKKFSAKLSPENVQAIMNSEIFYGKTIHGLFPCYFKDITKHDFIKSESEISFSEKYKEYIVLMDEGINIILPSKNKKRQVFSINYDQISSASMEEHRLTGTSLVIAPTGSDKNLEFSFMEKVDGETALYAVRSALQAQGKEIIVGWFGGPSIQWKELHGFDIIITNKRIVGKFNPEYEKKGYKTGFKSWAAGLAVRAIGGGILPAGVAMWALEEKIEHSTKTRDHTYFNENMLDQIDFQHLKKDISGLHIEFVIAGVFGITIIEKSGVSSDIIIHGKANDLIQLISIIIDGDSEVSDMVNLS
jgi:hypothetical protein